jgi:hypothetical protein
MMTIHRSLRSNLRVLFVVVEFVNADSSCVMSKEVEEERRR